MDFIFSTQNLIGIMQGKLYRKDYLFGLYIIYLKNLI
jgi:hypothetical protein